MTEQLDLFAPVPTQLTVADLDEWMSLTRAMPNAHAAGHYPNGWARTALGALLGEEIPHRRWSTRELLSALARAREIAVTQPV